MVIAFVGVLCGGCALSIVPQADSNEPVATESGVLVFGNIIYIIDCETKLPYGAFRPLIPPPHLDLLQLENGNPLQSRSVSSADGSYTWRMQPGHYVISGIGQGQFIDDYRIAWPRLAFKVEAGGTPIYLGNLQLIGRRYAESYTLSTGTKGVSRGIRYEFLVVDELSLANVPSGGAPKKSLMFYRPNMPTGEQLVDRWRISRDRVIKDIFEL
jgi:hypothetical protein